MAACGFGVVLRRHAANFMSMRNQLRHVEQCRHALFGEIDRIASHPARSGEDGRAIRCGLFALAILLPLLCCGALHAQQSEAADSTEVLLEQSVYYDLTKTRLTRWVRQNIGAVSQEMLTQVVALMEDAQSFADQNDFETAQLFLDTALELTETTAAIDTLASDSSTYPMQLDALPATKFEPQFVSGFDLWRQEFELSFIDDTTFYERSANPYVGFRLRGELPSKGLGAITTHILAKSSRDYYSGEAEVQTLKGTYNHNHLMMEHRAEWTSYRDTLGLQFWQYRNRLRGGAELAQNFVGYLGNDFRYRRYREQTGFYPNYLHNISYAGLQYLSGLSTRLAAEYSLTVRRHPDFALDDYHEQIFRASVYQSTATNSSIALENIYRVRDYALGGSDSTYQNPFREEYLRGDFRFGLTPTISFDLQGDVALRQHKFASLLTPDFLHVTANPRFLVRLFGDWQLGMGYLYVLRVHSKDIIRTGPTTDVSDPARAALDATILGYEDYFSHGFSVSLELFRLGAFMLNLTNNFEYRTYPDSQTNRIDSFSLYSDRQINSTFLFLTWRIQPQLEVNLFANYDEDRSRNQEHNDSRNTLLSVELGYTF